MFIDLFQDLEEFLVLWDLKVLDIFGWFLQFLPKRTMGCYTLKTSKTGVIHTAMEPALAGVAARPLHGPWGCRCCRMRRISWGSGHLSGRCHSGCGLQTLEVRSEMMRMCHMACVRTVCHMAIGGECHWSKRHI